MDPDAAAQPGTGAQPDTAPPDVGGAQARIADATGRLLASLTARDDAWAHAPSLLPGWTRGHVLTHLARNADGLSNLLRWAATGIVTPMYASDEARDADIEAGAGRPAADVVADLRAASDAFAARAASMPAEAWSAVIQGRQGDIPAHTVLTMRLSEVEVHHADLGAAYRPQDWTATFAADQLPRAAAWFTGRDDVPACLLRPDGAATAIRIGPGELAGGVTPVTVSGPAWALLAWVLGRGAGEGLGTLPGSALPVLPRWR